MIEKNSYMITTYEILDKTIEYFSKRGYALKKPTGLISPVFPHTFNPSAAHAEVMNIIGQDMPIRKPSKFFVIEQCFRHVDVDKIGQGHHAAFFQMAAYVIGVSVDYLSKKEIIEEAYNFLINKLDLDPNRLFITVFGGGRVKNLIFKPDVESFEIWKQIGIPKYRLIKVKGANNFVYLQRTGDAAGPRCEIYYDVGKNYRVDRYIEIGSVIFDAYRFENGQPVYSKNVAAGGAFGIERLAMILNDLDTIYQIDTFDPLVRIVENYITDQKACILFSNRLFKIVDVFKAIIFIINAGQTLDKTKRGEILKKLIHLLISDIKFFSIEDKELYEKLIEKTIELYKNQYPSLVKNRQNIIKIIKNKI